MNTQPEVAQIIQHMDENYSEDWDGRRIRAELRRLYEVNQELLSACRKALYALKGREHDQFLRDAIAKATREQS